MVTLFIGLSFNSIAQKQKRLNKTEKKQYSTAVTNGDKAWAKKDYLKAKVEYQKAEDLKTAQYTTDRIKAVNDWLDKKNNTTQVDSSSVLLKRELEQLKMAQASKDSSDAVRLDQLDKEKAELEMQLKAQKSFSDSLSLRYLALTTKAVKNKTYEKVEVVKDSSVVVNTPVKTVPTPVDSTKKPVVIPKKTGTQTTYVTARMGFLWKWEPTPKGEKTIVQMPKKGTIDDNGKVVRIRKSDLKTGNFDKIIAYLKIQGREIEEVQK